MASEARWRVVVATEGGEVNGVAYTVTGVSCEPTS